jgi:Viral BACON domain
MLFFNFDGRGKGLLASAGLIALIAQGCGSDEGDDRATGGGGVGGSEPPHAGRGGSSGATSGGGSGGASHGSAGDTPGGAAGMPADGVPETSAGAAGTGASSGSGSADPSLGGTSGAGDEAAGSGGAASAELAVSTEQLAFSVVCPGPAVVPAKTFTLSNPGGASLTWSAASPALWFSIVPASGTLAPGAHADVTISPSRWDPPLVPANIMLLEGDVTITSDALGAPKVVHVTESNGFLSFSVVPPANIDFGLVAVLGEVSVTIPAAGSWYGAVMASSNTTDFSLNGFVPGIDGKWTLKFRPGTVGPHTTTLTIGSMFRCVLSPNTFTATGTGIVN